jgi:hypothetical protein
MAQTFRSFVKSLIDRAGSATAVADQIGMSVSAFQRGVQNNGSLGVTALLRLAKWAGESPVTVLNLAGKRDAAALIDELMDPGYAPQSGPERELVGLWRNIKNPNAQQALYTLLRALAEEGRSERNDHGTIQQRRPA